jgi:hypothetical protein
MTAPDASLETLADWLGPDVERGPDALRAGAGALPGVGTVTVHGNDGVPGSLSAWYPGETGPTLGEAESELGPAQELGRLQASPPQVAFAGYDGTDAACFIAATTWDPPGMEADRRIFQIILRRDEIPRETSA